MIIGITGTHGAGKGTVVEYLRSKKGFAYFSVSEFLAKEVVKKEGVPDRPARSNLANEIRHAGGPMKLMELVCADARASGEERIIVEPQYTKAEVDFIKEQGGIVLAVDADLRTRYDRIVGRASPKDQVTFEAFAEHQAREMAGGDPNVQNLSTAIEAADHYILNNSTLAELNAALDVICEKLGL